MIRYLGVMMTTEEKIEDKIHHTEKKLRELSIILKRLDSEYQQLLAEMELTPEQVKAYVENAEDFPPQVWAYLQKVKLRFDEGLNLAISNVPDVERTKKTLSERGSIQKHWLFVR